VALEQLCFAADDDCDRGRRKDAFLSRDCGEAQDLSESFVLISIQVAPAGSPERSPLGPLSTRSDTYGEGKQVIAASTFAASERGESLQIAPFMRSGFAALGSTSCTCNEKPARKRLAASLPPRAPSPMKP